MDKVTRQPPMQSDIRDYSSGDVVFEPRIALEKAQGDPFNYMAGIRGGLVVEFHEARCQGNGWITLLGEGPSPDRAPVIIISGLPKTGEAEIPIIFERGIDVRIRDILWAADAPYGS